MQVKENLTNKEQGYVFISHATKDDSFVKKLQEFLEQYKIPVWVDSRSLRGGSKLEPEIEKLFLSKLKLILGGNRNISLAMDSRINYKDAAELHLLLEWLVENGL